MARPKKINNLEEIRHDASPESADPTAVKANRGRPKKAKTATKSKPKNQKQQKTLQKNKNSNAQISSGLPGFIPSEALVHFAAAIHSFLSGMRSLIDMNLEALEALEGKKSKKAPSKKLKKIVVEEETPKKARAKRKPKTQAE